VNKARNTLLIFLLIVGQSALAIIVGIAVLFNMSSNSVPAGALVRELPIGGMSYSDAVKKIEADYSEKFKLQSLLLEVENGKTYKIPFYKIDASVDGNATISSLKTVQGLQDIPNLLNAYFGHSKPELQPVIKFNEGKLRLELAELAEKIYIAPTNAAISYKGGIIEKNAETVGLSLNVTNTVEVIRKQLSADPWGAVRLIRAAGFELQAVDPDTKLRYYDDLQQVLSEYTTQIVHSELSESIKLAVDSINGEIIPASVDTAHPSTFSFVELLMSKNAHFENDNEGYDQVASTLYAALLTAGLPIDSITRLPHKLSVDYIEPGLDAWISGSTGDLKFINPFNHKVALFAQIEGGRVKVVIVGSMGDKKTKYEIKTEIVQKFAPPVYNIENKSLKPGEKIVLNPGKEGVMVNVYRNDELIGPDKYEAEKTIIQIGPVTEWNNNDK